MFRVVRDCKLCRACENATTRLRAYRGTTLLDLPQYTVRTRRHWLFEPGLDRRQKTRRAGCRSGPSKRLNAIL